MEMINLGKADGLPPVDWAVVAGKLDASADTLAGCGELAYDVAVHHQRGRQPACDCGRCPLGRRRILVSDGRGARKGRNVARDPRCSVAVSVRDADVVIEGDAVRVTDRTHWRASRRRGRTMARGRSPMRAGRALLPRSTRRR